MTGFSPGDVVVVPFPFTDLETTKKRPALVLSSVETRHFPPLVTLAMITSQMESETIRGDTPITHWQEAGLIHNSKVRLAKLVTVDKGLIQKKLGSLSKKDRVPLKKEFRKVFSGWF